MDTLNEKIEGLVKKSEKSKMPYGILKKVYDRGMAAWKTGHRPGTTPQQWAFARVNSFITKSSGTWGKADADLAKQVRGEQVENRTTASEMLGQVKEGIKPYVSMMKKQVGGRRKLHYRVLDKDEKEIFVTLDKKKADDFLKKNISKLKSGTIKPIEEKLDKDADAGDYVKDFKKSDAPQFKGKSDKKKEKMAIAAYLDSKEEVELEEGGVPARFGLSNSEKMKLAKDFDKLASANTTSPNEKIYYKDTAKYFMGNMPDKAFNDMMGGAPEHIGGTIGRRTSAIIGKDKTKKVISVYREEFKEESCPKCDDDPCKCENIQESGHTDVASMKTQVQIAKDALEKMNTELGKLSDEEDLPTWWTNKVASAVGKLDGMADYIDAKHQQGDKMNEASRQLKDPKKETMVMKKGKSDTIMVIDKKDLQKYTSKGYLQVESNLQEKDLDESLKFKYAVVDTSKNNEVIAMSSDEKEMKDTMRRRKKEGSLKVVKLKRPTTKDSMIGYPLKEEIELDEETVFVVRFEKEGMRFATPFHDMKNAKAGEKILKKSSGVSNISITKDLLKPGIKLSTQEGRIVEENLFETEIVKEDYYEVKYVDKRGKFESGRSFKDKKQAEKYAENGNSTDKVGGKYTVMKVKGRLNMEQELDNSLMAQAARVISQTAVKEKLDPADVDDRASPDDRKAADKNIVIQLRRAQDMKGKADVTFKNNPSKKEKIDIRVINKALDMFDKMKPNDKTKMQTMIGKSYRDLLKVVQRGKV